MKAEPGSRLARLRQQAHRDFDPIRQSGDFTRSEAYAWLAKQLGIRKKDCHMQLFDEETCQRVSDICLMEGLEVVARCPDPVVYRDDEQRPVIYDDQYGVARWSDTGDRVK